MSRQPMFLSLRGLLCKWLFCLEIAAICFLGCLGDSLNSLLQSSFGTVAYIGPIAPGGDRLD
jgi:hypothetical protein